ncbi:MAG: DUF120 domain-containing protein [archaeon]
MKPSLVVTLYELAETISASDGRLHTTVGLARKLGFSQQTISRHLIKLEEDGYVTRRRQPGGETIHITDKGMSELRKMHATLDKVIHPGKKEILLEGEVFSGLGEGAYYVSRLGYSEQFRRKLGFVPFPGTLNLRLDRKSVEERGLLEACPHVVIDSFTSTARTFGSVQCCRVILNGKVEAYLITAYRTHYGPDVLEIVSSHNLRKALNVKDGDKVTVFVPLRSSGR